MKEKHIDNINKNLLDFNNLFHSKIGKVFRKNIDSKYKCNKNQKKAIITIGKHDSISPSTLGKYLDMRKGSLTTLIDSLVEKNLVLREVDEKDRRRYLLSLTEEGEEYLKNEYEVLKKSIFDLFEKLDEADIKEFSENMSSIVEIMKKV